MVSRRVGVVTDSSAQLPPFLARPASIEVVSVAVLVAGEAHAEAELEADDFYRRLADGHAVSTSTPSPAAFTAVYDRLAQAGAREVISLHLDGRLSGTVGAARLGADSASIPVHVVDTRQVSLGVGLCAVRARAALDDGAEAGAAAAAAAAAALRLSAVLRNASFVATPPTPGRVDVQDALIEVSDGRAVSLGPVRDAASAVERLGTLVLEADGPLSTAVGYAARDVEPAADHLAELLGSAAAVRDVLRYRVGPSVGAHTGGDTFGCFWWPEDEAGPIRGSA